MYSLYSVMVLGTLFFWTTYPILDNFAENSNKFFNWIVLLQFFTSAVSIGLTMFQLTIILRTSWSYFVVLRQVNSQD
ncbi:hypothetical protein BDFB_012266 [Asbolus verrucosus]|uniref:7tm 6 domain containing protein n=1 Tax=Asbolus verrucosus TaxID=1661398 RepID=A0A482VAY8_ASBVE|nr:hypothetical protein BDFB_012266 [Asbolus verrucosus]